MFLCPCACETSSNIAEGSGLLFLHREQDHSKRERDVRSKPLIIHAPLSVMMSFFGRKWSRFPWTQCVENEHCNVIM